MELDEKVIKQVIGDWMKPYKWMRIPDSACRWIMNGKGKKLKIDSIRASLLATLPTALVNAKGILKWRKGG